MGRLFGTDGVRGVAGKELTCELAFKLGRAGAYVLTKNAKKPKILVGRDTRVSGGMLEAALCAGICSVGVNAEVVGVMPTPAVAYLTRYYKADAGVVISASHNPFADNGIKFFDFEGFKLPDETEDEIERIITSDFDSVKDAEGRYVGNIHHIRNAEDDYINYIKSLNEVDLTGIKIAIDCSNGAASHVAPRMLSELGLEVISIYDQPNGHNINDGCGSTHIKALRKMVTETGASMGLAFDGDADRMLAVDETGEQVDGDMLMMIFAQQMKKAGKLKKDTLVATVMSNLGLKLAAQKNDINLETTAVGDRYVLEQMLLKGYNLGGEQSGHIIFLDENTTGDGLLSALRLVECYAQSNVKMSELVSVMKPLPQVLINVRIDNTKKSQLSTNEDIAQAIKSVEEKYQGTGRILVRPSGTEPLIRVMIEGPDQQQINDDADEVASLIGRTLG